VEGVSWFEPRPRVSLAVVESLGIGPHEAVVDVGGGASRLVDHLVALGWSDVTVLDVSAAALRAARARLGDHPGVTWLHQDVLTWRPTRRYGLWHDRAVLHFLTDPAEARTYRAVLRSALAPNGAVVLGTFSPEGPETCSGLPVRRYAPDDLAALLGEGFEVVEVRGETHTTPTGARQPFTWVAARLTARGPGGPPVVQDARAPGGSGAPHPEPPAV
jgi:SAM-dependent methyltransferase